MKKIYAVCLYQVEVDKLKILVYYDDIEKAKKDLIRLSKSYSNVRWQENKFKAVVGKDEYGINQIDEVYIKEINVY